MMCTVRQPGVSRRRAASLPLGSVVAAGLLLVTAGLPATTARADRVQLADGRILEGRFARLPGVAIDPLEAIEQGRGGGETILMCDDELSRTMVSKRRVQSVQEAAVDPGMERIRIPQRVP